MSTNRQRQAVTKLTNGSGSPPSTAICHQCEIPIERVAANADRGYVRVELHPPHKAFVTTQYYCIQCWMAMVN